MTDYPKALYKGAHYLDWMAFCRDLEMRKVEQIIVADADMEKAWREQGFVDAATLMEPVEEVAEPAPEKRRGMPKGGWPKKDVNT